MPMQELRWFCSRFQPIWADVQPLFLLRDFEPSLPSQKACHHSHLICPVLHPKFLYPQPSVQEKMIGLGSCCPVPQVSLGVTEPEYSWCLRIFLGFQHSNMILKTGNRCTSRPFHLLVVRSSRALVFNIIKMNSK